MFSEWKMKLDKEIHHLKWKYKILKIKWVLLFVLPMLIIVFAYQVAKQYLKIRMQRIGGAMAGEVQAAGKNQTAEDNQTAVQNQAEDV